MSDKIKNIIVSVVFMLILIGFLVLNIIKKDTIISITERRKLAQFPKITSSKLLDGTAANQFDSYTMDQFIQRDEFRKIKSIIELKVFGKKDVNNMYEYNGFIIKQEYPLNNKSVLNIANKINTIKDMYLDDSNNVYYSIVPDKNYFIDDTYLKLDYKEAEKLMSDNLKDIKYINIFDKLSLNDYYYTDTHWKQERLLSVLDKISIEMDFKNRLNTEFKEKELSDFNGVYSGQLQVNAKKDIIKILTNNVIENSTVYNFETKENTNIYNMKKLEGYDKYDVYLSGAASMLTIENPMSDTDKELIVFRDSFGSSLVPLFTEAYSKIIVLDTRYIGTKYLGDYVDFKNKDVLFIYSTLVINNSSSLK